MSEGQHWPDKRRVTVVGAVLNLLLSIGKVAGGIVGQSQALIADGVHSLSDLASDGLVLLAARFGSREADHNHPYGHARIETLATLGVGLVLLSIGAAFLIDSATRILEPARQLQPGWLAFWIAVLSVLVKEGLYHYTVQVARRTESALLVANAWHHRSDALSSVVVIVGVVGAMMGMRWLDSVAAAIVGIMLGWVGWRLLGSAAAELVDTGLSNRELNALSATIDGVNGVVFHRQLRSRRMGGRIFVDVRVHVDPDLKVAEAEQIRHRVAERMIDQLPGRADVVISIASADQAVE
ncbi:MAG: cation diffusion facilitator family transporter [Wenzhouxiangella sp.]